MKIQQARKRYFNLENNWYWLLGTESFPDLEDCVFLTQILAIKVALRKW
jgi:hypothetical protein